MNYDDAVKMTPEEYRHFLVDISRFDKKRNVTIHTGYITVDGRIQMAADEATDCGEKVCITTDFETIADQVVCCATVRTVRGEAKGHARAFMDATFGADATNPLETAETSAVGRALGFLGYGVFGGIASADEVDRAVSRQENIEEEVTAPQPAPTKAAGSAGETRADAWLALAATPKQLDYMCSLMQRAGYAQPEINAEVERLKEDRDSVSERIGELKEMQPGDAKRRSFWAQARQAMAVSGKTEANLRSFMIGLCGKDSTKDLTDEEARKVLQWLSEPIEEEDDIPDPPVPEFVGLDIDEMPVTWTTVQLLCDGAGIPWEQMDQYLQEANKVDDVDHLSTQVLKRTIAAFKSDAKGHFLSEVRKYDYNA